MKIFLIGMMGTGKSYWCKKLSKKLKVGGYDLDFLIESHEEKTISEIFKDDGEAYFRRSEARILRWFGEKKSFVLATGGGCACYERNIDWMNDHGVTIWIDESIKVLVERLKLEKEKRPLIQNLSDEELQQFLTKKLVERYPYYLRANYHLQGAAISDAGFAKIIKEHA